MTSPVAQARYASEASFRYVSGDVCLDLVNTADWTERGLERDRLTDYGRLLEWARGAGILQAAEETRLRTASEQHPHKTAAALETILDLRGLLHRMFVAAGSGAVEEGDLAEFNDLLAGVAPHLRIVREPDGRLVRGWAGFGESIHSVQWAVAWAAAELLASNELSQVRLCAGTDCGWLYVDRSRNGLRRWCEMEVCGTAAKNRRRSRQVR